MLVCGNSELSSTVEDELIIQPLSTEVVVLGVLDKVAGPHVVHSEPEDLHALQEWVLISTGIAEGWR